MSRQSRFYEGCGREGPIRCIFLCEFHHTYGPTIICQVPEDYISKDDFEPVSVYIIPKVQLIRNIMTITVYGFKILGFPVGIEDNAYARNAYIFNLCFVFDNWARSVHYEPVIKKLTEYLVAMETEKKFISQIANSPVHKLSMINMLTQVMNDLNTQKMSILAGLAGSNVTTHLKVTQLLCDPPVVLDYEVPVLLESNESLQSEQWDLTTTQILPYINGVNHVTKISASADVDNNLVKSCLQNLVYYGIVSMIPIFQYSNIYVTTSKLRKLATERKLQDECITAVARGKFVPQFRDVFNVYANMRHGITVKNLCVRFNFVDLHIDERNLIQFGILEGVIRRIYKYPILLDSTLQTDIPHSQYFTGEYSMDQICCHTGLNYQQLEDQIQNYQNVVLICK